MTDNEVRELIRRHAERAGSVRALAKEWGMSQAYLDKQIRGVQAIGDMTLKKLKLVRRKTYEFYTENTKGLSQLAADVGTKIVEHDAWREAHNVGQREQGRGSPMTMAQVAKLLGISTEDLERLRRLESDLPPFDAKLGRLSAWKAETIYRWLRSKSRRSNRPA
jgi:predicted DNA-binding transcriptional regulator AlpA